MKTAEEQKYISRKINHLYDNSVKHFGEHTSSSNISFFSGQKALYSAYLLPDTFVHNDNNIDVLCSAKRRINEKVFYVFIY